MGKIIPVGSVAALTSVFFGALSPVFAEQVLIGHLETNDDIGINWLYFKCDKLNATQMRCDIIQMLIMKMSPAEIEADLKREAAKDPLAEFNNDFGQACKPLVENGAKIQQAMESGIGMDGKPINKRVALSGWPMMKAMIEVCKSLDTRKYGPALQINDGAGPAHLQSAYRLRTIRFHLEP